MADFPTKAKRRLEVGSFKSSGPSAGGPVHCPAMLA